ncbi:MAG: metalloregulator ArsR/SmtB family transcription factor [Pyrinomonadaceae bacterium]|nr:metalloregulator ArsR/SmtB family transcription factor [Pyrinomonadaceae bacterium]
MPKQKKWEMSPEALILVAERFKILAEPVRLSILQALETGEKSVTDIANVVASTQPNVSKHLKMLQDAGLLARRQEGNTVYYSIADKSVFALCDAVCASVGKRLTKQMNSLNLTAPPQ